MMKKFKQYTNYKDCDLIWLNKIPEHWEINSFRNILDERNEKNSPIKSNERLSLSINKGVTLYADKTTNLDRFKDDFTKYKLAHKGDLVLNSMNMIVGAVGVSNYFGCVSPIYYTFASYPNNCNSTKYYEYLFRSKTVQGVLFSLGRGLIAKDRGDGKYNTLRLKVSRGDLRSLKLPNPNYSEQTQIVSFLNFKLANIDRFIRKKKQLIKLLNEQKAAIINQAVTKGLDPNAKMKPSGIEWLGDIPEHWQVWKLGRAYKYFGSGTTPSSGYSQYYQKGTIPWVNTGDLNDSVLNDCEKKITQTAFDDYSVLKIFPKGTLSVAMYGASIGKISIINFEATTNQACCNFYSSNVLLDKFTFLWFIGNKTRIVSLGYGGTQPNISQGLIKALRIPVPPKNEQIEIIEFLEKETAKLNQTISTIEKEIALVEEYKTALIAEAVTGKIDVRDFEIPETVEEESYEELEEELSIAAESETEYETEEIE
jgi:type I restriction enzyme, S subunit